MSAGGLGVNDLESPFRAGGVEQHRVGLFVVPLVGIRLPVDTVEVQDLRFDFATAGGIALFLLWLFLQFAHSNV